MPAKPFAIEDLCAAIKRAGNEFTRDGNNVEVRGFLDLHSLTTLPEGVTLSAGGGLDLSSLTGEVQRYQGKTIRLRTIDGYCTRLISRKKIGDATAWIAQYFKGNLKEDRRCFVAQSGEIYAHGDTLESALRDLRFKIAQVNFDLDDLIATIRQRKTVTFNDYRLITGACESGLREGLRSRGIDPDTEELPLKDALELCRNGYGGDVFRRVVGV